MKRFKFWWKGEPIIVGSLRWLIIENDLLNDIKIALTNWKAEMRQRDKVRLNK